MIKNYFKNIKYSIKNLYKWFFIIWNDRDWDHIYIEIILHKKLVNTYNFFTSEQAVTEWTVPEQQKSLKALRICINILDRRLNDFYLEYIPSYVFDSDLAELCDKIEKRDEQLLGKLLGKYLSYWWD
jgi:hypothetical protein